jgi:hypothetical protein
LERLPKPKKKKYAKADQTLQKAKVSLVSQFCFIEPFTIGYFWAISFSGYRLEPLWGEMKIG